MTDLPQIGDVTVPAVSDQAEIKSLLKETLELERENNDLLKRMQKIGRIAFWSKVVIYAILIGLPLLLIAPLMSYLSTLTSSVPTNQDLLNSAIFGVPSPETIKSLLGE